MTCATRVITVVLADDTDDIRFLTRMTLDMDGEFAVIGEAADGRQAVALVADLHPDLLVLDLAMPVMDGLQVLPLIRERAPDTRVVVLSGFEHRAVGDEAIALGAARYVQKGVSLQQLVDVLRDVSGVGRAPT